MIYPDSAGNGGPEAPEHVYTVKFTNEELWGAEAAEPNGVVYFDVWEPYIVPARTGGSGMTVRNIEGTQEEIAARVKALEAIMIEKGIMTTAAIDRLAEIYENEVGPQLGAASSRKPGPTRSSRPGCWPTPPRRAPRWASAACRARTWSSSRTPTPCTT